MTLPKPFPSAPVLRRLLAACLALTLIAPGIVNAAVPTGFTETLVASGISGPTAMTFAPDGRLFVAQQGGQLRVIKNGALLAAPFVTINVNASGERGLLGVAFDPSFPTNGFVYVYYTTATNPIHNRISRFTASGDTALGGETVIFELNNLSAATNHNGGAIHFGSDGKLYVAVGENANGANSQSLSNLLGKMLRINPDGTIPTDNPATFGGVATTGQNRAIWAIGLRNPFTFSFQRGTTRMFINDVGQATWEEIDDGIAGSNYGWPTTEGPTTDQRFRAPLYYYGHPSGECAITGGAFYNPQTVQFPADYVGDYFFADYCASWIKKLDIASGTVATLATGASNPVDLQVATDGSLYYVGRGCECVRRIGYTGSQAPTIGTQPAGQTVSAGQSATFSVSASGAPPLAYQWQRNQVDISGATSTSYTLANAQVSDSGAKFRVRVSNGSGSIFSNEATLTVNANQPQVYRNEVLADNPISYWRLGEQSGTTAADEKNANAGTYVNNPALTVAGAVVGDSNTAITLASGASQYVNVAAYKTVPVQVTIEAWVKGTSFAGDGGIAGWYDNTNVVTAYLYVVAGAGTMRWRVGNTYVPYDAMATLNNGRWHHVVGTYDGTNARFYYDGVLVGGPTAIAHAGGTSPYSFKIGNYGNPSGTPFNASIDEVAVYGSALSAARILAHYHAAGY